MILATLDAVLNFTAAVCLMVGLVFMRQKRIKEHRAAMLTAFVVSVAFLITYLVHHAMVGSVPFRHPGFLRTVYFLILIPHVLLAITVPPLAILTLYRGWTQKVALHRKIARVTWPIWMYVSVSGVVVYLMLYWM